MNNLYKIAATVALAAAAGGGMTALAAPPAPAETKTFAVLDKDGKRLADYTIPSDTLIDKEPNAEQIRHGQRLLNETRRLLPNNTGASLNCSSCHVQQGKKPVSYTHLDVYKRQVRRHAALGGISRALALGEAILAAQPKGGSAVIDAICKATQGEIIGSGKVVRLSLIHISPFSAMASRRPARSTSAVWPRMS